MTNTPSLAWRMVAAGHYVAGEYSVRRDPNASPDNRWSLRNGSSVVSAHRLCVSAKNRAASLRALEQQVDAFLRKHEGKPFADAVAADEAEAHAHVAAGKAQIDAWLSRHDIALRDTTDAEIARVAAAYHAAIEADEAEAHEAVAADLAARTSPDGGRLSLSHRPEMLFTEQPQQQAAQRLAEVHYAAIVDAEPACGDLPAGDRTSDTMAFVTCQACRLAYKKGTVLPVPTVRPTPVEGIRAKGGRATLLDLTRGGVDIGDIEDAVEAGTVVRVEDAGGAWYLIAPVVERHNLAELTEVADDDLVAVTGRLVKALDDQYRISLYPDGWAARMPGEAIHPTPVAENLVRHAANTGAVRIETDGPRPWLSLPPVRRGNVVTVTPRQSGPQFDVLANYDGAATDQLVHVMRRNVPEGVESGPAWVSRSYVRHVKAGDIELCADEAAEPVAVVGPVDCPQCRMRRPSHKMDCSDPSRATDDRIVRDRMAAIRPLGETMRAAIEAAGPLLAMVGKLDACPAGDQCAGAAFPGHPAHPSRRRPPVPAGDDLAELADPDDDRTHDQETAEHQAYAEQAARDHGPTIYAQCLHASWVMLTMAGWWHPGSNTPCEDDAPYVPEGVVPAEVWLKVIAGRGATPAPARDQVPPPAPFEVTVDGRRFAVGELVARQGSPSVVWRIDGFTTRGGPLAAAPYALLSDPADSRITAGSYVSYLLHTDEAFALAAREPFTPTTPTIAEMLLPSMPAEYHLALTGLLAGHGFADPHGIDVRVPDEANPDAFLIHDSTGVSVGVYARHVRLSYPAAHAGASDEDSGTAFLDLSYGTSYETVADVALGLVLRANVADAIAYADQAGPECTPGARLDHAHSVACGPMAAELARSPYVGEGADGARRSADIDRSEADTYETGSEAWQRCMGSADRWDEQAEYLDAQDGR